MNILPCSLLLIYLLLLLLSISCNPIIPLALDISLTLDILLVLYISLTFNINLTFDILSSMLRKIIPVVL
jgi:hypothetical protein